MRSSLEEAKADLANTRSMNNHRIQRSDLSVRQTGRVLCCSLASGIQEKCRPRTSPDWSWELYHDRRSPRKTWLFIILEGTWPSGTDPFSRIIPMSQSWLRVEIRALVYSFYFTGLRTGHLAAVPHGDSFERAKTD